MKKILSLLAFTLMLGACERAETYDKVDNDYMRNFDVAWKLIDENYCFLSYKEIDWDKVYDEYKPRVEKAKDEFEFFDIMSDLVDILRDGHSAILSNFDKHASDYKIESDGTASPKDYISIAAVEEYLTPKLIRATKNNFYYGFIERDGHKFAYVNYPSFSVNLIGDDLKYVAQCVNEAEGLILDIRNNPGGVGAFGLSFAGHFFSETTVIGYSARKSGVGHDDFTEPDELKVVPSSANNWANKPTILLTNRGVYSTANIFTCAMRYAPNVTLVGGRSGGGGGLPEMYYLPNGWALAFPSNVLYDREMQHMENGFEPDIEVHISKEDSNNGKDTILEKAIEELLLKME